MTAMSPLRFAPGKDVIAEEAADVVKQAAWSACNATVHYAGSFAAGPDFLEDAFEQPSGDRIFFDAAEDVWEERYANRIKVGVNVAEIRLTARCLFAAMETG